MDENIEGFALCDIMLLVLVMEFKDKLDWPEESIKEIDAELNKFCTKFSHADFIKYDPRDEPDGYRSLFGFRDR